MRLARLTPILVACLTLIIAAPAAAKGGWSCQYAQGQLLLSEPFEIDPAPPKGKPEDAKGLGLRGKVELVLAQRIAAGGKADRYTDGRFGMTAYIRDNGASITYDSRPSGTETWLFDRVTPRGSLEGMFMRPGVVTDGIGRSLRGDYSDLTLETPEYVHFVIRTPDVHFTPRLFLRVPMKEFRALHAKGVAKMEAAIVASTARRCGNRD